MLANRIVPYVAGNILYGVAMAKNVIVVTHFPELIALVFLKLEGGPTFEFLHEAKKIRVNVEGMD
ncbi:MAG TPA: hypothetical protein VFI38_17615 [Candidatus Acidoferrum sp.]|nr:hypothetical protein [Candidatus Acidoferrum sp.]